MTAVTSEGYVCDHECTGFEFGKDVFFADADSDASRLCEITDSTREECTIFDRIEDREDLFSESLAVFSEKIRNTRDTIYPGVW